MKIKSYYYKDGTTSSEYDTSKVIHRIDGPAYEHVDGMKLWYVDGEHYVEIDFHRLIEEVKRLSPVLRLIDPREWVRKL